jgi:hypothetical protein
LNIGINYFLKFKRLQREGKITDQQVSDLIDRFNKRDFLTDQYYIYAFNGNINQACAYFILEHIPQEPSKKRLRDLVRLRKTWASAYTPEGQRRIQRYKVKQAINEVLVYRNKVLAKLEEYKRKGIPKRKFKQFINLDFGLENIPKWLKHNETTIKRNILEIYEDIHQANHTLEVRQNPERQRMIFIVPKRLRPLKKFFIDGERIFDIPDNQLSKEELKLKHDPNYKREFERKRDKIFPKEDQAKYKKELSKEYKRENYRNTVDRDNFILKNPKKAYRPKDDFNGFWDIDDNDLYHKGDKGFDFYG